jgi:hypothetical protein
MLLDSLHAKKDAIESARREFGARRIRERGDLTTDEVLYDATLRNLQTLSEATHSEYLIR